MQCKNRIVDAKFLQCTYEGHILVLVPTGGDLLVILFCFLVFIFVRLDPEEGHVREIQGAQFS